MEMSVSRSTGKVVVGSLVVVVFTTTTTTTTTTNNNNNNMLTCDSDTFIFSATSSGSKISV
jgi:hypothetical protein